MMKRLGNTSEKGKYTVKVIFNEKKNQMPVLAYCKEFDLWAEHETVPEALSALFDGIKEFEGSMTKKVKKPSIKTKEFDFIVPNYDYA